MSTPPSTGNANIPYPSAPFLVGRPESISPVWWAFLLSMFNRTGGSSGTNPPGSLTLDDVLSLETLQLAPAIASADEVRALSIAVEQLSTAVALAQAARSDSAADMVFSPLSMADSSGSQAPRVITPTASPFTYLATSRQALHIIGGTISSAAYARGATSLAVGLVAGGEIFEMNAGDTMTITYLTVPTITMIPR